MTELDREEKLPFPPHDKVGDYYNKGEIDWINQKLASAKEEERQRIIDLLTSGKGRETGIWHYELNDHSEMEASYTGDYLSLEEVIGQLTNPKKSNQ